MSLRIKCYHDSIAITPKAQTWLLFHQPVFSEIPQVMPALKNTLGYCYGSIFTGTVRFLWPNQQQRSSTKTLPNKQEKGDQ